MTRHGDRPRAWAMVDDFDRIYGVTLADAICLAALHAVETETNTEDDR